MLRRLRIRNLAIIEFVELELGPGLNVLTGETGAGKSILVTALELVLGGKLPGAKSLGGKSFGGGRRGDSARSSPGLSGLVRSGASAGEVEALFDVRGDDAVLAQLESAGALSMDGPELVVRRMVSPNGRTRAFINGKPVSQQLLATVVHGLADISSQHEHHTLSDPSTHLRYLDAFAGAGESSRRVARAYHALVRAEAAARDFEARVRDRTAREALLHAQIRDIEEAAPEAGEDTELEQNSIRLRGMDELLRLTAEAAELLYERDDSVVDGLAQAGRRLARAAELDALLAPLSAQLEALRSQLEDVSRELVRYAGNQRPDPAALQRAEERIHLLSRLKRRYGGSLEAVLDCLARARSELEELGDHTTTSETLEAARARALAEAETAARALSAERHDAAGRLSAAISRELASLGMGEARVRVELTQIDGHSGNGNGNGNGSAKEGPDAGAASSIIGGSIIGGSIIGGPTIGGPINGGPLASSPVVGSPLCGGPVIDGARLTADGLERAEFLIAANRGEEARSLHRIASGGELSRAMLAIKCVLADLGPAGMYAFDEVDAGVGGGMAEIIGRKIRQVAQHRQVLCITHLAQIAVFADQHFKVEKVVRGERTLSTVRRLSEREQREEIARMLGGVKITAKTRAVARELLQQARRSAA
jgi:DNA repair protein RecN (Recombination protein N)